MILDEVKYLVLSTEAAKIAGLDFLDEFIMQLNAEISLKVIRMDKQLYYERICM